MTFFEGLEIVRFPPTLSHLPSNLSLNLSKVEKNIEKTYNIFLIAKAISSEFCSSTVSYELSPQDRTASRDALESMGFGWEKEVD